MADAERIPGARWMPWRPDRLESAPDPLPAVIADQYAAALAAAENDYRLGRPDEALRQLSLAASVATRRTLPHILSAEIHGEAGRRRQALDAYRLALAIAPSNEAAVAGYRWLITHADIPSAPPTDAGAAVATMDPSSQLVDVSLNARSAFLILAPYLVWLAVAEFAVTYVNPLLVFPLHGGMLGVAAVHVAFLERRAATDPRARYLAAMVMALMLTPLIRIISLTLPLSQIDAPYRYLFAGIPMLIGAVAVARYVGLRPSWMGLIWRDTRWQIIAVAVSICLGFIEWEILQPNALGALPWTAAGWLPALSVAAATGLPEELIFRGIMQTVARPLIGRLNVLYVSLVFAVLHIGYQNAIDFGFVLGVGLFYGVVFERTRSIIGISIGHGVANAVLFFVVPQLLR